MKVQLLDRVWEVHVLEPIPGFDDDDAGFSWMLKDGDSEIYRLESEKEYKTAKDALKGAKDFAEMWDGYEVPE